MNVGRPKVEYVRSKQLNIRVSEIEFEEITKLAEKLKISKTEAILRGIKLLKNPPRPILTRSQVQIKNKKPRLILPQLPSDDDDD